MQGTGCPSSSLGGGVTVSPGGSSKFRPAPWSRQWSALLYKGPQRPNFVNLSVGKVPLALGIHQSTNDFQKLPA